MYILISGLYLTALSCFDTIQKLGMLKCFAHLFCVNNITQNLFHGYLWSSRVLLTQGLCQSTSTSSCGSSLIQRKNPNIFNIKEKKKYGIMVLIEQPPVFVI